MNAKQLRKLKALATNLLLRCNATGGPSDLDALEILSMAGQIIPLAISKLKAKL